MGLIAFFTFAVAGEPTIKGARLLDDGKPALSFKTQSMMGTTITTVTGTGGAVVVVFSVATYAPGQAMLSASFDALGATYGAQVPPAEPGDLLLAWWKAGVIGSGGADRAALDAWCKERGCMVNEVADQKAKLAAYAASHAPPAPVAAAAAPAPKAAPAVAVPEKVTSVSVSLHIDCDPKVRLFIGSSPTSGGTYGWEYDNNTRSTSVSPGDVICICDERDRVGSCWTAGDTRADLEVMCGGFRAR